MKFSPDSQMANERRIKPIKGFSDQSEVIVSLARI